jgi:hypothetical protein
MTAGSDDALVSTIVLSYSHARFVAETPIASAA